MTTFSSIYWFYSSDIPIFSLHVEREGKIAESFNINFYVSNYHKPINDKIIVEDDGETDKEEVKYWKDVNGKALKNQRFLEFDGKSGFCVNTTEKLYINFNCEKYYLTYGRGKNEIVSIPISEKEASDLADCLDKSLVQGIKDARGDFKKFGNEDVKTGISSCLKCICDTHIYVKP